jgi:hypothetical protein
MTFPVYIFFDALLKGIYLAIKILLFTDTYNNPFNNVNEDFLDGFPNFVNAHTIILAFIVIHTVATTPQTTTYFREHRLSMSKATQFFMSICLFVIWCDFIASFVCICVKYGLLVYILYTLAVCFLIMIGIVCTCCCTIPIILILVGLIMSFFKLLVCCQTETLVGRFVMNCGAALSTLLLSYLFACLCLTFQFLFVGGPKSAIVYMENSNQNEWIVIYLFCAATILGLFSVLFGCVYSCCDNSDAEQEYLHPNQESVDLQMSSSTSASASAATTSTTENEEVVVTENEAVQSLV